MRPWIPARRIGVLPLCLAAIAIAVAVPRACAQGLGEAVERSYPTNLSLLTSAANAAVSELFLNFSAPRGASLLIESEVEHEGRWFVQNLLLNRLTEQGFQVYLRQIEPIDPIPGNRPGLRPAEPSVDPMADPEAGPDSADEDAADPGAGAPDAGGTGTLRDPAPPATDYILRFRVAECGVIYPRSYRKSPFGSRMVERLASVSLFATLLEGDREAVAWVGRGDSERLDTVPSGKLPLLEGKTFPFSKPELEARGLGAYVEPALVTGIVAGLIYLFYTNQN